MYEQNGNVLEPWMIAHFIFITSGTYGGNRKRFRSHAVNQTILLDSRMVV